MNTRYHPLGQSAGTRKFREQEILDDRRDLPMVKFKTKLRINDKTPGLGKDPYNHVGRYCRKSKR